MSRSERQDTSRTACGSPSRTLASTARRAQSESAHDIILVPSSPDLPPMPASSSMPPPATTTPHASAAKFSLRDLSFSSSPSLPSRTSVPSPDVRVDKNLPTAAREFVTLESTPSSDARAKPPTGATRSAYFSDNGISSSPSAEGSKVSFEPARPAKSANVDAPASRPERYESGDLVQAVERRRDWTPPPTDTAALLGTSPSLWSSPSAGVPASKAARSDAFKALHSTYGCKDVDQQSTAHAASAAAPLSTEPAERVLAKRMPIEAFSVGGGSDSCNNTLPTKAAAPKKKPRTITELAMAAYADLPWAEEEDEPAVPEKAAPKKRSRPKRQLEVVDENSNEPLPTQPAVVRPGFPTTKLRKLQSAATVTTTADGKKVKKPRKKPAPRTKKQVVLSPESARTESMQQNFLFGTSSQLAADDSPTFLRQLHVAMQESNEDDDSTRDLFDDASEIDLTTAASAGASSSATARGGSKTKLWGAAWRGEDGQMTFEHVIDLEEDEAAAFPEDPHQVLAKMQSQAEQHGREDDTNAVGTAGAASNSTAKPARSVKSTKSVKTAKVGRSTSLASTQPARPVSSSLPLKPAAGARTKPLPATQPPSKAQSQIQPKLPPSCSNTVSPRVATAAAMANTPYAVSSKLPTMPAPVLSEVDSPSSLPTASVLALPEAPAPVSLPKRPNFDVLTTAQLSKKVSSYGYKPMKVRSAMVALLNQCWDAKNGTTPSAVQTASLSTTSTAAAKVKSTKASASAVSPGKSAKTTAKARTKKTATAPDPPEHIVYEIEDSEASDCERCSSPEVPCSVASDASLAYDSEGIASDYEAVGELGEFGDAVDDAVDDAMDETLDAEPTSDEARLFRLMTEVVTTAPSSTNLTQPSWHEKMLMYDTIILEEFTEWLNSAVGVDTEITALQAKKWCESKSVCCTWRKNTRGKERKL